MVFGLWEEARLPSEGTSANGWSQICEPSNHCTHTIFEFIQYLKKTIASITSETKHPTEGAARYYVTIQESSLSTGLYCVG